MAGLDDYLAKHRQRYEDELAEFLRIPSVSADSRHAGDIRKAADFVADHLRRAKLDVEIVPTAGHPIVVAEKTGIPNAPTLLIYGHYDVQPPDPLELWITGPFEPTVRNGNIHARGATDDKGQVFTYLKALEAWSETGNRIPINVKVIIEGEEEVGSKAIGIYLREQKERLACDYVVISDTCQLGPDLPAITYGLKGIAYFEIRVQGPNRDLHSGTFGGSVQNPANALAAMLAALKGPDGKINVPGFYDDVVELGPEERMRLRELPFDVEGFRKDLGVPELFGEAGYSTLEHRWVRPTCDINGIFGGYQGEGSKTVLPAKAGAKVSFRLVPKQDPAKIETQFRNYLKSNCPPGVTFEVLAYQRSEAVVVPVEGPAVQAAARAMEAGFGKKPVFIREGGSIPIVSDFKAVLGADSLLLGFGLPDDNTHSPNEKFCLRDFHRGIKTAARLFAELEEVPPRKVAS